MKHSIHIPIHMPVRMHIHKRMHIHVHMHQHACTHTHTFNLHMHIHLHLQLCMHIYIYIHRIHTDLKEFEDPSRYLCAGTAQCCHSIRVTVGGTPKDRKVEGCANQYVGIAWSCIVCLLCFSISLFLAQKFSAMMFGHILIDLFFSCAQ